MKKRIFLLLLPALLFSLNITCAPNKNDSNYSHVIDIIERCSFYDVGKFDTLYSLTIIDSFRDKAYRHDYQGWVAKRDTGLLFLTVKGREINVTGKDVGSINPVQIDESFIRLYAGKDKEFGAFGQRDFDENYLIGLWLHKKGKSDIAKRILPKFLDTFFKEEIIINDFGTKYYDGMLQRLCRERNYAEAIKLGNHLKHEIFKNYEYQKEAIELTRQLQSEMGDFKTFYIPRPTEWLAVKQKLSRVDQIKFLAERLRLINCIQPGQPAGISYTDPQFALPIAELPRDVSYWEYNEKYSVINPYNELAAMHLEPAEVELLLPYLLDESYIPTYTYHRDFFSGRTIHKLSWVLNDLIFEITDKHFFSNWSFDSLDVKRKTAEVEKIKKWCAENKDFSMEERTNKILNTATSWSDFAKALESAIENKYPVVLPVIERRFNDFPGGNWPSHQGAMARVMFEYGNEKYVSAVRKWNDIKGDEWVTLWTSLFLLRYDKESYNQAIGKLEVVLKECDGTAYYPHAIDVLLNLKNKRAQKLAEGVLIKEHFQMSLFIDYNFNVIKKLLLAKSDYTLDFICKKLDENGTPEPVYDGSEKTFTASDLFVVAIDKLRQDESDYYKIDGSNNKQLYKKELSRWLRSQYGLLKSGKHNEMKLAIIRANEPVWFLDAAND